MRKILFIIFGCLLNSCKQIFFWNIQLYVNFEVHHQIGKNLIIKKEKL